MTGASWCPKSSTEQNYENSVNKQKKFQKKRKMDTRKKYLLNKIILYNNSNIKIKLTNRKFPTLKNLSNETITK